MQARAFSAKARRQTSCQRIEQAWKGRARAHLDCLLILLAVLLKVLEEQTIGPVLLVQVQEHGLLELSLAEVDGN